MTSFGDPQEIQRFRTEHALRSLEDALALLEPKPADAVDVRALERVRDDLAVLVRCFEGEAR